MVVVKTPGVCSRQGFVVGQEGEHPIVLYEYRAEDPVMAEVVTDKLSVTYIPEDPYQIRVPVEAVELYSEEFSPQGEETILLSPYALGKRVMDIIRWAADDAFHYRGNKDSAEVDLQDVVCVGMESGDVLRTLIEHLAESKREEVPVGAICQWRLFPDAAWQFGIVARITSSPDFVWLTTGECVPLHKNYFRTNAYTT